MAQISGGPIDFDHVAVRVVEIEGEGHAVVDGELDRDMEMRYALRLQRIHIQGRHSKFRWSGVSSGSLACNVSGHRLRDTGWSALIGHRK